MNLSFCLFVIILFSLLLLPNFATNSPQTIEINSQITDEKSYDKIFNKIKEHLTEATNELLKFTKIFKSCKKLLSKLQKTRSISMNFEDSQLFHDDIVRIITQMKKLFKFNASCIKEMKANEEPIESLSVYLNKRKEEINKQNIQIEKIVELINYLNEISPTGNEFSISNDKITQKKKIFDKSFKENENLKEKLKLMNKVMKKIVRDVVQFEINTQGLLSQVMELYDSHTNIYGLAVGDVEDINDLESFLSL